MKYIKLKELVTINPENINKNYPYNGIKYLDTANITNGKIDTIVDINIKDIPSRAKRIVKQNDIVYSTVRPNLCHYGLLRDVEENLIVSTGFVVIRCNLDKVLPEYLYAYLTLPEITIKLHSIAETSTSAYPSIKPSDIENLEIPLPTIEEQKRISKILSVLDLKMNLNTKTNDNLYKIIKTQYDKFINNIDEYELVKLKDIANIGSGKRPKIKGNDFNIPLIGASGVMAYTDNYNFNEDILIIGRVGTLGVVQRYFDKIWASDNTLTIKTEFSSAVECYLKTVDYISLNRGSTQPLITQTDISNLELKFNKLKFGEFENQIRPLRDKIYKNELQNETLEQLRDTLLPKLMNGEIDLDKIEI